MRSRDGNYAFSLRLCSIILFNSLALHAGEYLVSYRYIIKDAALYNETLFVSKAMKKCTGEKKKELILSSNSTDLKETISQNSEEFIEYMHKLGLQVENIDTTKNLQNSSITILTLKTTCFKVDFNDNFVRIAPLK